MIELDGRLVTDNMVFAVVLCLNGYHPEMKKNHKGVIWSIPEDELGEDIEEFLRDFNRGRQLVEPRRFAREWSEMRKDVYKMMGVGTKPQGLPIATEPAV